MTHFEIHYMEMRGVNTNRQNPYMPTQIQKHTNFSLTSQTNGFLLIILKS